MINLKFLVDYRGKLTKERFYRAGETKLFQDWNAKALVDRGVAVEFKDDPVEAQVAEVEITETPEPEEVPSEDNAVMPKPKPKKKSKPKSKPKKKVKK